MQIVSTPIELHKALQVEHAYYMSAPDGETHASVDEFINNWKDYDIDLNHIIRWDFHVQDDADLETIDSHGPMGSTYCDVVFVMPRKGYLFSNRIKHVKAHETPKLLAFLKKHWEYMQSQWGPVPEIDYISNSTPRSEFLIEIERLTNHRVMTWFNPLVAAQDESSEKGSPTRAMDRAAAVAIQQVVGDVLELIDKGIPDVNGGYALVPYPVDGQMGPIEDIGDVDIAGDLSSWYFNMIQS